MSNHKSFYVTAGLLPDKETCCVEAHEGETEREKAEIPLAQGSLNRTSLRKSSFLFDDHLENFSKCAMIMGKAKAK